MTEREPGNPELSFEEGFSEILSHLEALVATEGKLIVMSINGTGPHVGKTYLTNQLRQEMREKGWGFVSLRDSDTTPSRVERAKQEIERAIREAGDQPVVVLFDEMVRHLVDLKGEREVQNHILRGFAQKAAPALSKVHLWVALSSPVQPFHKDHPPLGDIVIVNEKASKRNKL